jgi:uncharacterized protein
MMPLSEKEARFVKKPTQTIAEELLSQVDDVDHRLELPKISGFWVPPLRERPQKGDEFGALFLEDGTVGLMFVQLEDTLERLHAGQPLEELIGANPAVLARDLRASAPEKKALGYGAVNAISQHVIRASGLAIDRETDSIASFDPKPTDHIGMIGFFPPLVKQLRSLDVRLTVVELKRELVEDSHRYRVTLDPRALAECTKILATSTMLLNDSIDEMLGYCGEAELVAVIGPGAGFLPDPLFARGVDTVGGHQVVDAEAFRRRCEAGKKWRETSRKYAIHRGAYPGYRELLRAIESPQLAP